MNINTYETLISNLPVRQQCSTTKRKTWLKAENEISWLKQLNDKIFGKIPTLTISRQDIFETKEPREIIIKSIYWGYTGGMRGNHFVNILKHIDTIENAFSPLRDDPPKTDFNSLTQIFKKVPGLGLSTYSKLLYFFKISFNKNPCLILDQRLIDVFKSNSFDDFNQLSNIRYSNANNNYLEFLKLVSTVAKKIETQEENIELFLFTFGNNLKATNMNDTKISNM